MTIFDLRQARTCDERKPLVEKLRSLGDPRALSALRGLRGVRIGRVVRLGGTNTACMKKELPAAIKALENKS